MANADATSSDDATIATILDLLGDDLAGKRILDLGAGAGALSARLYDWLEGKGLDAGAMITACDLYPALFRFDKVECLKCDLTEPLPFDDGSFNLVLCVGAVENAPSPLDLIGEIGRIVEFGGRAFITTANVLRARARLHYLVHGLFPGFDLLPVKDHDVFNPPPRISPISLYYLYYFTRLAGFGRVRFHFDAPGKGGRIPARAVRAICWIADRFGGRGLRESPNRPDNEAACEALNRWETLVGGNLVLEAVRLPG